MYQNIPTKVLTCEARLSYVHLVEPYQYKEGGDPKYQVTLLIPKTEVATKAEIDAAIRAAYEDGVKNKWKNARPQLKNALIYDGDGNKTDGTPFGDECKGCWVMTVSCSSKRKPQVVGIDNINCELAPADIYSGMYARVTINFFAYDSHGSKGVGCGLGNVMKTRDGEPLSGGASAASDFADIGQSVTATATQYGYAAAPNGQAIPIDPITGQPMMTNMPYVAVNPITGQPIY